MGAERGHQRDGAVAYGYRVLRVMRLGEASLKVSDVCSAGELAGSHDAKHGALLSGAQHNLGQRDAREPGPGEQ
jgi:hypothetical protein